MASKINKSKLLLVEGRDEINFFTAFLSHDNISDIQIIESKGKEQFPAELELIINDPDFDGVTSIGVVRDADESQQSAVESIRFHLNRFGLPAPVAHCDFKNNDKINVGVFIAPGFSEKGMLESLILESLESHPVKIAAGEYIENLRGLLSPVNPQCQFNFPRNEAKSHMHAFLAGMEKFVPSCGMAAMKGYYDFTSPVFNEIRQFLTRI